MRSLAAFITCLAAPATAHPGHLADLAGHDHWTAGAAIGAIALAGLLGLLKGRRDRDAEADTDEAEAEPA